MSSFSTFVSKSMYFAALAYFPHHYCHLSEVILTPFECVMDSNGIVRIWINGGFPFV